MKRLTAARLREVLRYDPETGQLWWRINARNNAKAGTLAGNRHRSGGYIQIKFKGGRYLAHRLIWLHVYGEWPRHEIDHIDGDKSNNRISNLRDVPHNLNLQNQRCAFRANGTGLLGASYLRVRGEVRKDRFVAKINGRHLGTFNSAQEAHHAYIEAKRKHHEGCTI